MEGAVQILAGREWDTAKDRVAAENRLLAHRTEPSSVFAWPNLLAQRPPPWLYRTSPHGLETQGCTYACA